MTGGVGVREHTRESLVARFELVEVVTRYGDEAPPWSHDSLTGAWTWEDQNVKRTTSLEGSHLVRHRAHVKDVDVVGAADHVVVAELHHHLRRRSIPALFLQVRGKRVPHPFRTSLGGIPGGARPGYRVNR